MQQSFTEKSASDRAKRLIEEALGILMQGTTISPEEHESPRSRAEAGIRDIAEILWELSEGYELHADLKAVLWDITNGSEPTLPDWLRREWQHAHDAPENLQ